MKLALLDKNSAARRAFETLVLDAGFHCTPFRTGRELLRSLQRAAYDVIAVDWDVADLAGPSLIEGIRNQVDAGTPLLLATAPLTAQDTARALEAGADCVLAKPCAPEILVAQLRAMARRSANCEGVLAESYARHTFRLTTRTALVNGKVTPLTPKEFTLGLLLFRNLNRAVSRYYILETIWGIDPGLATRTLDIHISKIRAKLGLRPEGGYRLSPVYGYGYRLEEHPVHAGC